MPKISKLHFKLYKQLVFKCFSLSYANTIWIISGCAHMIPNYWFEGFIEGTRTITSMKAHVPMEEGSIILTYVKLWIYT